jgi:hypothetical protein
MNIDLIYNIMNKNGASIKNWIPPYLAGFACIAAGLFYLSSYSLSSLFDTMTALGAFIAGGLMLYLGWLIRMGMDIWDSDDESGGGRRVFLDKPALWFSVILVIV